MLVFTYFMLSFGFHFLGGAGGSNLKSETVFLYVANVQQT